MAEARRQAQQTRHLQQQQPRPQEQYDPAGSGPVSRIHSSSSTSGRSPRPGGQEEQGAHEKGSRGIGPPQHHGGQNHHRRQQLDMRGRAPFGEAPQGFPEVPEGAGWPAHGDTQKGPVSHRGQVADETGPGHGAGSRVKERSATGVSSHGEDGATATATATAEEGEADDKGKAGRLPPKRTVHNQV